MQQEIEFTLIIVLLVRIYLIIIVKKWLNKFKNKKKNKIEFI